MSEALLDLLSGDSTAVLAARADAIPLAGRCAHAAVVASAGAGNAAGHDAQRVGRETLVVSVLSQGGAIPDATAERLSPGQA